MTPDSPWFAIVGASLPVFAVFSALFLALAVYAGWQRGGDWGGRGLTLVYCLLLGGAHRLMLYTLNGIGGAETPRWPETAAACLIDAPCLSGLGMIGFFEACVIAMLAGLIAHENARARRWRRQYPWLAQEI